MATTSASLFDRIRKSDPDPADWRTFHDLYAPLIRSWLTRTPGLGSDADDVLQDVLTVLVREITAFERQRDGSFRAWLRQVTVNRVRTWRRARDRRPETPTDPTEDFLRSLEDPSGSLAETWDREHTRHVTGHLLAAVRPDFTPAVWAAFERLTFEREPAAAVAAALNSTVAAVLQAKARVLRRLRREAGVLLD